MQKQLNKDNLLWKSFKDGDDKAFYNLYDQYIDLLFSFGMQYCSDDGFVKDCIHDLFLDLYKYRDRLGNTDSIRFYLYRSLRRKIHKEQAKRSFLSLDKNKRPHQITQTPAFEETLIKSEIQKENLEILKKAVSQLTEQQQKALFLKFEQDLTYPEIASILNISTESARTNVYRALKALRKSISNRISLNFLYCLFPKFSFDLQVFNSFSEKK